MSLDLFNISQAGGIYHTIYLHSMLSNTKTNRKSKGINWAQNKNLTASDKNPPPGIQNNISK